MSHCFDIPQFISKEETTERKIIVLHYPNTNGQWPEQKILFYQSSGMSNDRQEQTSGTWFPFYSIMHPGNRGFFEKKGIKKMNPESGKETDEYYVNGYFIKLSMVHQIYNKGLEKETQGIHAKKYYTKEINVFLKRFIDSLQNESDFKEFDHSFIIRLNDYFTEVNQIILSVWLDAEANFWKDRHLFVAFVKNQSYYQTLPDRNICSFQEPSKKHDDVALLSFLEMNGFPENYPVDNIEKVLSKPDHFIEQQDPIQYKQKSVMKMRTDASKKRLFSNISLKKTEEEEPLKVPVKKLRKKNTKDNREIVRKSARKGGRKRFTKKQKN